MDVQFHLDTPTAGVGMDQDCRPMHEAYAGPAGIGLQQQPPELLSLDELLGPAFLGTLSCSSGVSLWLPSPASAAAAAGAAGPDVLPSSSAPAQAQAAASGGMQLRWRTLGPGTSSFPAGHPSSAAAAAAAGASNDIVPPAGGQLAPGSVPAASPGVTTRQRQQQHQLLQQQQQQWLPEQHLLQQPLALQQQPWMQQQLAAATAGSDSSLQAPQVPLWAQPLPAAGTGRQGSTAPEAAAGQEGGAGVPASVFPEGFFMGLMTSDGNETGDPAAPALAGAHEPALTHQAVGHPPVAGGQQQAAGQLQGRQQPQAQGPCSLLSSPEPPQQITFINLQCKQRVRTRSTPAKRGGADTAAAAAAADGTASDTPDGDSAAAAAGATQLGAAGTVGNAAAAAAAAAVRPRRGRTQQAAGVPPVHQRKRAGSKPADNEPPAKRGPAGVAAAAAAAAAANGAIIAAESPDGDPAAAEAAEQLGAGGTVGSAAAAAAAARAQQQQAAGVHPVKKAAGVPPADKATYQPQLGALVHVALSMLEHKIKCHEATTVLAQLENYVDTGDASGLDKPPEELVKDLAGSVEDLVLPLTSRLLLESQSLNTVLSDNPHFIHPNMGHHAGNPGWIQCRGFDQPPEEEAAARAASLQKARRQRATAQSFKQRILACTGSPAEAVQLFKEVQGMTPEDAATYHVQLQTQQGGLAAGSSAPAAAAAAGSSAPGAAAAQASGACDASQQAAAGSSSSSNSRGAAAGGSSGTAAGAPAAAAIAVPRRSQRNAQQPRVLHGASGVEQAACGDTADTGAEFETLYGYENGTRDTPYPATGSRKTPILWEEMKQVFHLPIKEAAQQLKIGTTTFTKCKNHFGIQRWPNRTLQAIQTRIEQATRLRDSSKPGSAAAQDWEAELEQLREAKTSCLADPNTYTLELPGDAEKAMDALDNAAGKAAAA